MKVLVKKNLLPFILLYLFFILSIYLIKGWAFYLLPIPLLFLILYNLHPIPDISLKSVIFFCLCIYFSILGSLVIVLLFYYIPFFFISLSFVISQFVIKHSLKKFLKLAVEDEIGFIIIFSLLINIFSLTFFIFPRSWFMNFYDDLTFMYVFYSELMWQIIYLFYILRKLRLTHQGREIRVNME